MFCLASVVPLRTAITSAAKAVRTGSATAWWGHHQYWYIQEALNVRTGHMLGRGPGQWAAETHSFIVSTHIISHKSQVSRLILTHIAVLILYILIIDYGFCFKNLFKINNTPRHTTSWQGLEHYEYITERAQLEYHWWVWGLGGLSPTVSIYLSSVCVCLLFAYYCSTVALW